MAVKCPVVTEKEERKPRDNQRAPLRPAAAPVSLAEVDASLERPAAFDPCPFLAKLTAGQTGREYGDKQAIFSQGDKADAVFYIQSGKVKLTVVSRGFIDYNGGGMHVHSSLVSVVLHD